MWKSYLAGRDGPNRPALPVGEFFHPLSLLALSLLIVNDWILKPSPWAPSALTGKLSDVAGLVFFPLLLTALVDCALLGLARLGLDLDFSLRRGKLLLSIASTALCFTAVKLSSSVRELALDLLQGLGLSARIVADPSDLVALLALWLSWRIGMTEIARVPLGRIEFVKRRYQRDGVVAGPSLHDIVPAGADPALARELIEALDAYLSKPSAETASSVETHLAALRDLSPK